MQSDEEERVELILVVGTVAMIGGALPLFHGYRLVASRSRYRRSRRSRAIAWDAPAN
ncbi:hypothetical protein M446_3003 [Methylobacterium sp. 4-46]|nr:hypothetical protein M446_3003 [Methylobacterium sp. 4-46]